MPVERKLYKLENIQPDYYNDFIDVRLSSEPPPDITVSFEIDHRIVPGVLLVTGTLYRVNLELVNNVWTQTKTEIAGYKTKQIISFTSASVKTKVTALKLRFRPEDLVVASPTCSYSQPERGLLCLRANVKTRFTMRLNEYSKKLLIYVFWHTPNCIVIQTPKFPRLLARLL
jgi:hypothetical protein